MKIAYVASEITPFASTGGLAEVAASFPAALGGMGHQVLRIMPMYRSVMERIPAAKPLGVQLSIPVGFHVFTADIWKSDEFDPPTYFIRRDEFFDRTHIYGVPERDYDDNFERYIFFQKAVVALLDHLDYRADVVHGNDWPCGLLPYFLSHGIKGANRKRTEAFVFTIHNLAYQGLFPGSDYALTNLPFHCFAVQTVEFYGKVNCLKGGITGAHSVTTVSTSFAKEMLTKEWGFGLEGLMASVAHKTTGILNGVDTTLWNPATDSLTVAPFSSDDLTGKQVCRRNFLKAHGLQGAGPGTALLGMVTRMVDHKGMDVLAAAMPELMKRDVSVFIMGSGQGNYEAACREWCRTWPGRVGCLIGFDIGLSHQLFSAADLMLIPSRYEPCGLSQFYAMHYGTLPVAHAVGGMKDSITDIPPDGSSGTGFLYSEDSPAGFLSALDRGLALRARLDLWTAAQQRAMVRDFSWRIPAQAYVDIYSRAIAAQK